MRKPSSRSWQNSAERLLRPSLGFVVALCAAFVLWGGAAQAQTPDRERLEVRVRSLSDRTLMSAPVVQLIDPQRQRLGEALADRRRPLFFAGALLQIVALLWLWRSGRAAYLRDALRRRFRNVHALRFAYVATVAIVVSLAALPAAFVSYRIAVIAGLSRQSPAEWLGQAASTAIVNAVLAGVVFGVMFALAQRTRLWYLYGSVFLIGFVLFSALAGPVVLAPWLHDERAISDPVLAARLGAIAAKAGAPGVRIVVETIGPGSRADVARVAGFGPTAQIVLSDALLRDASPSELSFVVARESVHVARNDVPRLSIYAALMLIVAAGIAVTISDRIGFRRDDDPLSRAALLGTFLGLAILLLLPVVNAYSRRLEARADLMAIAITGDPAGAVRSLVRSADVNLIPVCPPPAIRRYFLTSPPIGTRIGYVRGTGDPCP